MAMTFTLYRLDAMDAKDAHQQIYSELTTSADRICLYTMYYVSMRARASNRAMWKGLPPRTFAFRNPLHVAQSARFRSHSITPAVTVAAVGGQLSNFTRDFVS